jgi:chaperone modulatory protein CbpM
MSNSTLTAHGGIVVEHAVQFTLIELCRACHAEPVELLELVDEGVLLPSGDEPAQWRFDGALLQRARAAVRLTRDLELTPAGTAVVLDLLDEIAMLRTRLQRLTNAR